MNKIAQIFETLEYGPAPESAQPAIVPGTYHYIGTFRIDTGHFDTSSSHHRIQRLDTMDAIPEKIRMMRLQRSRTESIRPQHLTYRPARRDILHAGHIPQGRGGKHRHFILPGGLE